MRIKSTKTRRNVVMEVGPGESRLLSESPARSLFRLKRILVPIDFSERSHKALEYAIPFAKQFQAEILCLHVIEIPYGAGESGFVAEMEAFRKDMLRDTRKRMDELRSRQMAGIPSRAEVRTGAPYHEITRAAEEENIDLVIMATHGRTGLGRFFLGSTTERVVRHAHCPVLVVREHEHEFLASPPAETRKRNQKDQPAPARLVKGKICLLSK